MALVVHPKPSIVPSCITIPQWALHSPMYEEQSIIIMDYNCLLDLHPLHNSCGTIHCATIVTCRIHQDVDFRQRPRYDQIDSSIRSSQVVDYESRETSTRSPQGGLNSGLTLSTLKQTLDHDECCADLGGTGYFCCSHRTLVAN